jgi:general secretion pathway protein F/type IV pilus assembly protein PilC
MLQFKYVARERSGGQVAGVLAADSVQDANRILREKALFPVRVEKAADLKSFKIGGGPKSVSSKQLAKFYSQFSDLMRSGVPLLRSLEILKRQSTNPRLRDILDDVHRRVADGESVADTMKAHESVFGELSVSMVRAGQEGGFLEDVFKRISIFTERQEELRSRIAGALAYPIVLTVIGTTVVTVLIVFFVPKFETIFDRLRERGELPAATEGLLGLSNMLQSYGLFILAGLALVFALVRRQLATPEGRRLTDDWKLRLPLFGSIFRDLAITRFNRVLGTLRRNGVPILAALRIAKDSTRPGDHAVQSGAGHAPSERRTDFGGAQDRQGFDRQRSHERGHRSGCRERTAGR